MRVYLSKHSSSLLFFCLPELCEPDQNENRHQDGAAAAEQQAVRGGPGSTHTWVTWVIRATVCQMATGVPGTGPGALYEVT